MYSKLQSFLFCIAVALNLASIAAAQVPAPASAVQGQVRSAPAPTSTLRGHITDPTGALIPGATVTVSTAAGNAGRTTKADAAGVYSVSGLAPGSYIVNATVDGFAPFTSQPISLTAGQVKRVDISMAVAVAQQSITVTEESPAMVTTEASGNASAIVLKDKDLEALSDDPDELSSELTALAGPSAGPNGGQIYIDGFTGGQLPPKSAIREIRINQNPFSAEFDKLGYGRIEILTKPGTDKFHGQVFMQGNDDMFNTGNPFVTSLPAYHTLQFNGTVNGALSKTASFFVSAEQRNIQNVSLFAAQSGAPTGGILDVHTRTNISPRIDLQLGEKNTLTLRYQFYRDTQNGELGSAQQSSSQAQNSNSIENTIQLSDSMIINEHMVNETRFQYLRDVSSTTGQGGLPQFSVVGLFTGGGGSASQINDHQDHLEFQNLTTLSAGANAIKFGTRLRENRDANYTDANFNGTFTFLTENDYSNGTPFLLTYTTGSGSAAANTFDAALFVQDDWKANKNLTVSGGLRWESQNHIADHSDWAPRAAFAYALDGHKTNKTKTVLRGGYGIFYDRLSLTDILAATRFSSAADAPQHQTSIYSPTCFNSTSLSAALAMGCTTSTLSATLGSTDQIASNYRSPYTGQFGASLERQLAKTTSLTVTYLHSFGVHQLVTRDANAPDPADGFARPDPAAGNVSQYYPEAVFKQNQMIVNVNGRLTQNLSLMGFYNLTYANSDGGAGSVASNAYNLSQDYARATFASRNMVFLMANYQARWGIRFNPFLIAQSGKPFNIVTNQDPLEDGFFNHRPSFVDTSSCATGSQDFVETTFGCFNVGNANNSATPIPFNMGNGPAAVAVNLRVSRAFGIGPKTESAGAAAPPPGGGPGGHGGHGGPGGGPGGGLGPGGLSGGGGRGMGGMFGPTNTGRKYSLTFNAQALNLFNDIDRGTPVGTISPTAPGAGQTSYTPGGLFGQSDSLAGGIFSSGAAARRIFLQAIFSF